MLSEDSGSSIRALARGLEVLRLFTTQDGQLSQTDIAEAAGLPLSTVYRLVRTLVEYEFLEQTATGRTFRLGPEMVRLSGSTLSRSITPRGMHEVLLDVSSSIRESVNLATLVGSEVVYLDSVTGPQRLAPTTTIGMRLSAHCTALGRCLLAQLSDEEILDRIGTGPYEQMTPKTARDWPDLRKRIAVVRATGIAISHDEFEIGLTGIAVGIPQRRSQELLGINVALPSARLTSAVRGDIETVLRSAAATLRSE